jgi:hypothetical protein
MHGATIKIISSFVIQNKVGNADVSWQSCRLVSLVFSDTDILGIRENILDIKFLPHFALQFNFQTYFTAISFSNLHPKC